MRLDRHDRLGEADVGQLRRAGDDVAHGPDARRRAVRWYSSATTKPRSSISTPTPVGHQTLGPGPPADRHHHGVDVERLVAGRAPSWCPVRRRRVPRDLDPGDDVDAALLEGAGDLRTMSSSHPVRMVSSASSTVTLAPRSASSEANSHPIDAAADDRHRGGELLEVEELVGAS